MRLQWAVLFQYFGFVGCKVTELWTLKVVYLNGNILNSCDLKTLETGTSWIKPLTCGACPKEDAILKIGNVKISALSLNIPPKTEYLLLISLWGSRVCIYLPPCHYGLIYWRTHERGLKHNNFYVQINTWAFLIFLKMKNKSEIWLRLTFSCNIFPGDISLLNFCK